MLTWSAQISSNIYISHILGYSLYTAGFNELLRTGMHENERTRARDLAFDVVPVLWRTSMT
jgi:hypothetical protein